MPGRFAMLATGPDTVEVSVAVTGGQLLEPDSTTGKVKPATAGSAKVLGVAIDDGTPRASVDFGTHRPEIGVAYGPCDIKVKYAANCAWGVLLVAAATGQVTPYTAGTSTHDQIVGRCTEPAGVTATNEGRMRLF
jgi:hypothetical protein